MYGVFDLTGNVREFIRSPGESEKLFMVIGGSYATDAQQANTANVYYVNGSAGDLGFRYVLELPELRDGDGRAAAPLMQLSIFW